MPTHQVGVDWGDTDGDEDLNELWVDMFKLVERYIWSYRRSHVTREITLKHAQVPMILYIL